MRALLLPMTDAPVATQVQTAVGLLDFQEYFVQRHHSDPVQALTFAGIESATPAPELAVRLAQADAVVFCPSNPLVSIGPILAVPGLRDLLAAAPGPRVGVSPIVGGQAIRGPAADMLAALGHDPSAFGVAQLYAGLLDGLVIDEADAALADRIGGLGLQVRVAQTVMHDEADRETLARLVLAFCADLRGPAAA